MMQVDCGHPNKLMPFLIPPHSQGRLCITLEVKQDFVEEELIVLSSKFEGYSYRRSACMFSQH
jgi:hypothetical protein